MATIGQPLLNPESGWRRYEDTDSRLLYAGTWTATTSDNRFSNSTWKYASSDGATISFGFSGTKLRVIGARDATRPVFTVTIDGIEYSGTETGSVVYGALVFEKIDMSDTVHTVTIRVPIGSALFIIDAIDINDTGYLLHPVLPQKSSINDMLIGDCIPCRYTVKTSGTIGYFSELGTCKANEIPVKSYTTVDGLFYFIHCGYDTEGRLKLIADRNLQYAITWDAINKEGLSNENNAKSLFIMDNVIKGASLGCDSTYVGYFLESIRDGNISSQWLSTKATGAPGCFITIDLGTAKKFEVIKISTAYGCSSFDLKYSDDGVNYTLSKSYTVSLNVSYQSLLVPNFGEHRYWKIDNIQTTYAGASLGLSELELLRFEKFDSNGLNLSMRLPTGGVASTDTDNEWDKIIVSSSLNGVIVPGSNNIWNWNGIYSWTSTTSGANTSKTKRGNTVSAFSSDVTSTASLTLGYRPVLIAELTNLPPTISSLILDRDYTYLKDVNLSFGISDPDLDNIQYQVLINSSVKRDFASLQASPISTSELLLISELNDGENTIIVNAKDSKSSASSRSIKVTKKDIPITKINSTNPDTNYIDDIPIVNTLNKALYRLNLDTSSGYIDLAILKIYLNLTAPGKIRISPITQTFTPSTVTYNTAPTIDTNKYVEFTCAGGLNTIDITDFAKYLQSTSGIYGIAFYTTDCDASILVGTKIEFTYVPVMLEQPLVVYSNKVLLTWKPINYTGDGSYVNTQIWRDTNPDFSTESLVTTISDIAETSYTDITLDGTSVNKYYYRIKLLIYKDLLNTPVLGNDINIPVPARGYIEKLTDPDTITYSLLLYEGLAFEVPGSVNDFYTAPDKLIIKPLNIGKMIGGRTTVNTHAFEVINTYQFDSFDCTLTVITPDGDLTDDMGDYGLLNDCDDQRGRTKVQFSTDTEPNFLPVYPMTFNLTAQQKKIIYIKVIPSLYNTVGDKLIKVIIVGKKN